nr:hypothetical protein [Tanacetum cinerariifolium]
PIELTNDEIRNSKAYKEYYACATGEAAPKLKASARKNKGDSASFTTPLTPTPTTTVVSAPRLSATAKGKQPARATTPNERTDVERTEAEQLKIVLKRSSQETHISQQHGSGTDEGTGSRPGVPDVPSDDLEEELSWNSFDDEDVGGQDKGDKNDESDDGSDEGSDDDNDETVKAGSEKDKDDDDNEDDDDNDEEEELAKNDDEDTETGKGGDDVNESERESDDEETRQKEEGSFDPIPRTPEGSEEESDDKEDQKLRLSEEARIQEEEEADELYFDVNINQGRGLQVTQNIEDSHVTLTLVQPDAFRFDERLRSLETTFSEYRQTNPFVDVVSAIPGIVHQYMTQQMTEAVREAVQIQTDRLQDSLQRENDEFLRNIDENMKKIIKGQVKNQVKEQVLHILPRIEDSVNATLEAEVPTRSSHSLNVNTLTPKLLAGPTYELMWGSCTSLTELECHLEEVYKATTDQLDWVNPGSQQYPHNLLQPLPLILDNQGRRVIPFEHFINNDLEYLWGGASIRKYTTSVTKKKAADCGYIKWIEDLVPHAM